MHLNPNDGLLHYSAPKNKRGMKIIIGMTNHLLILTEFNLRPNFSPTFVIESEMNFEF